MRQALACLCSAVLLGGILIANPAHAQLPDPATDADFIETTPERVELGRLLFFDKIISGNMNISCASCHHPLAATGDGLSLPVGEGGTGLGVTRDTGHDTDAVHERVPRNAPPIFNLGATEFEVMFHDGRVAVDPAQPGGFLSPAGDDLPLSIDTVLAAQAMFPVTSAAEMAGQEGENEIADLAAAGDLPGVWAALAERLRAIPEYVALFEASFDDVGGAEDVTYAHAARAMAAFEAEAWRADDSPFDQYLKGDTGAMSPNAVAGMDLFYGKAGCSGCHSGTFQTNHGFASIAAPQIGPGKGDTMEHRDDGIGDFGRERVTGDPADRFEFRVPTLRNIANTGPWGHAGAYDSLEAIIRHHLQPRRSLWNYDESQAVMPFREDFAEVDFELMDDPASKKAIIASLDIEPVDLTDTEVERLLDFMHALTDRSQVDLRDDVPAEVPSGLPIFD